MLCQYGYASVLVLGKVAFLTAIYVAIVATLAVILDVCMYTNASTS
jgi:hypothetical protein